MPSGDDSSRPKEPMAPARPRGEQGRPFAFVVLLTRFYDSSTACPAACAWNYWCPSCLCKEPFGTARTIVVDTVGTYLSCRVVMRDGGTRKGPMSDCASGVRLPNRCWLLPNHAGKQQTAVSSCRSAGYMVLLQLPRVISG